LRISGWGDGGDFKLVVFTIGNADLDLAAWAWARDFDLVGDFFFLNPDLYSATRATWHRGGRSV
jgi:hypothetical protein